MVPTTDKAPDCPEVLADFLALVHAHSYRIRRCVLLCSCVSSVPVTDLNGLKNMAAPTVM